MNGFHPQPAPRFRKKGVCFMAVNDGADSAQGDNDFATLRNIFNECQV